MAEFSGIQGDKSCAFFGEGVTFKGSITAPEKIVVHGTVEGDVVARELLVGPSGTIKGNVKVDQADVQGKVLENVEARVCLSLRKTGRIEGSATYGEIEIEKGGILSGELHALKSDKAAETHVASPPLSFGAIRSAADAKKDQELDKANARR
jgi:cytoskeletal protein CcmA (bactofilin family)